MRRQVNKTMENQWKSQKRSIPMLKTKQQKKLIMSQTKLRQGRP